MIYYFELHVCLYVSMCMCECRCSWSPEGGTRFPGARVTGSGELPVIGADNQFQILYKSSKCS